MKYPIFHIGETARVGPYAYNRRLVGEDCKIEAIMKPIGGENRYGVVTEDTGTYTILLESTLRKVWERCDWGMLRGVWQPKREAR